MLLWRLAQYAPGPFSANTTAEKLQIVSRQLDSLYDYEPATQLELDDKYALMDEFEKSYQKLVLREVVKGSPQKLAVLIQDEEDAYETYHNTLIETFRVLFGSVDGNSDSFMPAIISGISSYDARLRKESLAGMIDGSQSVSADPVTPAWVDREYDRFCRNLQEKEASLRADQSAWNGWMEARKAVSAALSGKTKTNYDNLGRIPLPRLGIIREKQYQLRQPDQAAPEEQTGAAEQPIRRHWRV